ncbi:MAG: DNA replication/repair protein RecF [Bacilli bacterium]
MIYLKGLKLTNYRCYAEASFEFSSHLNILVGANAAGKTSVAEAVHCLGFLKSHKASDQDLIRHGETFSVVKGSFEKGEEDYEIVFSLSPEGKRIQANKKSFRLLSEYLGFLHVVFFCPDDLEIVKGAPAVRRKFLDSNLCLLSPSYLQNLLLYRKVLKQRNEVLKHLGENQKYDHKLLEILTASLIPKAKAISEERARLIAGLNPLVEEKALVISGGKERVSLEYEPNLNGEGDWNLKRDLAAKTTTTGPHRDDFEFFINGFKASAFASQGQQRTAALALKLALADYLGQKTEDIIIILDDVFSELDVDRQNQILKLLKPEYQIFITTTTIKNLSPDITKDSKVLNIKRED